MRRRYLGRGSAALAALALIGTVVAAAPAAASGGGHDSNRHRAAAFHAAVVEDNEAYNAKDAARYEAILNPRMIFWQDGVTTYGRDGIMANARAAFATPNWMTCCQTCGLAGSRPTRSACASRRLPWQ